MRSPVSRLRPVGFGLALTAIVVAGLAGVARLSHPSDVFAADRPKIKAPELDGGVDWLNTAEPIKLADLKGKIVLLDFWTYCCINCIHILPDLAKLEKKYANELVVIGVHSAKFENEKSSENIRKAILRYQIEHPVVNDAEMKIWNTYGVSSWPSYALIDPEGNMVGMTSGEGKYDLFDTVIARVIKEHKEKKTLNEKPINFELARKNEPGTTPLYFPGKVLADAKGNRLFIADSTHNRVVITDLAGKHISTIGSGDAGRKDGSFAVAQFEDPQGLALAPTGDTLYIADRKNHLIREADLKAGVVKTIAGTGEQARDTRGMAGKGLETGLNSPWDILLVDNLLYIAMAGHHQIWVYNVNTKEVGNFAGDGYENIKDGTLATSQFAQPSGLTTDKDREWLYVADSEVSAIRAVSIGGKKTVKTIVGQGLFKFGDVDGVGTKVRLQHALGVLYHDGKLFVADTYNSKIKVIDPEKREATTFLGGTGKEGRLFNEPAGLSYANGKLYVADTNAHRIQVVDLETKAVTTLPLTGVEAPKSFVVAPKKD